ncbi:MAG: FAD-binding protein, partial [Planctomycetota bacterium]
MQIRAADTEQKITLRDLTTFRIGGRPSFYARPANYEQLGSVLEQCRRAELPVRVLGGGSNILVDDGELDFAVIHICAPAFDWIDRTDNHLTVGAGVRNGALLRECERLGLGGLEFMAGIPGTTGGAVAGNAGAWDESIGDKVVRLWYVDECGDRQVADRGDLEFGYRRADVPGG